MAENGAGGVERKGWKLGLCGIAALTFLCFGGLLGADFVDWDDRDVILHNLALRNFDLVGIFSQFVGNNYQPVTILSFAIEHAVVGARAPLYHLTNVALHALNSVLLPVVLARLFPALSLWVLLGVGFLFAVHPLHVESVAWVTERKDLLSTLFLLLAFVVYDMWLRSRSYRHYALLVSAFVLALLSKPMAVTFPLLLIVLDYARGRSLKFRSAWLEKMPLFVLSVAIGILTFSAQYVVSLARDSDFGFGTAVQNVLESLAFYLSRSVWPTKLVVFYETGLFELGWWAYLVSVLVLALMLLPLRHEQWRRGPYAFGLGFFLVSIVLVLKVVPFGRDSLVNDRYMYLPSIGLFLAMLLCIERLKVRYERLVSCLGVLAIACLVALTVRQSLVWRNGETLWLQVLEHYPQSFVAHDNLGTYYSVRGQPEQGVEHFEKALALRPGETATLSNLAESYGRMGDSRRSIETFRKVLERKPRDAEVHNNLGWQFYQVGDFEQAERFYSRALELMPKLAMSHRNLGRLHAEHGSVEVAVGHYRESLRINPYQLDANQELGEVLQHLGRTEEAKAYLRKAQALRSQAR